MSLGTLRRNEASGECPTEHGHPNENGPTGTRPDENVTPELALDVNLTTDLPRPETVHLTTPATR
eukprot:313980-Amphidinium_carterae.1